MTETLYLISGASLLLLVIIDFFYTTLSVNGAGLITKAVSSLSHKIIQLLVKLMGRSIYRFSGMINSILLLLAWIIVVWLGLYLVFTSNPEAITHTSGRMANNWERLYYTGYTLSTLGMGEFNPSTAFFGILTSCFSFFGFIFFTSSMTYLISVSSAVIKKRTLARSIQNLGKTPERIAKKFLDLETFYSYQQILTLQHLIDNHFINYQAYPVLHYFIHPEAEVSLSINFTRLDEAINILLTSKNAEKLQKELQPLRSSLTNFLTHLHENYSHTMPMKERSAGSLPLPYKIAGIDKEELKHRRKILGGFLRSESFDWEDVSAK